MKLGLVELPDSLNTPDWCEQNVYLSPRIPTSDPGQWRRQNVSALCRPGGPLEALDDPNVETVVVEKGSQTALTTTVLCWLAKEMATDPGSALVVMNATTDAKEKAAETWRPLWEDSVTMRRFIPTCRRKEWTKLYQLINGHPVYWIGANSAGRLGAKPIRRLILDEVDKYPQQTRKEAGAAALARQRTKGFRKKGLAKIVEFSTPTDDMGEVHQEFLNGDQRFLCVPCPHCGAEQIMVWASFKVDMDLAKTDPQKAVKEAHYECPKCKGAWTDEQRWRAIDGGEWRATERPKDPKCRSYRNPSWNSYFVTTEYLAALWIKAQESQSALHDFINSECGEPYVHYENMARDEQFIQLEGPYDEGQDWTTVQPYTAAQYDPQTKIVIAGVDVQKTYLVAVFRMFAGIGDNGLLWAGDVANFSALDAKAAEFDAKWLMVDMRYRGREVQEWAYSHAGYIPTQGVVRRARALYTINMLDLDEGKRGQGGGRVIETIGYDADMVKDILIEQVQRKDRSKLWLVPKGYPSRPDYVKQMTAEKCINGRWIPWPKGKPNHFWDAETLCLLGAIRFKAWQFDAMPEEQEADA